MYSFNKTLISEEVENFQRNIRFSKKIFFINSFSESIIIKIN